MKQASSRSLWRALRAVLFLSLLAMMVAACGGASTPAAEPTVVTEEESIPVEEEPAATEMVEEEPMATEEAPAEEPMATEEAPAEEPMATEEAPAEEGAAGTDEVSDMSGALTVLGFSLPDEIATVRVDTFEAQYPNVDLTLTEGALDEQQFLTAVASGTPPDLIYVDRATLSTYATRGALVSLDECIASEGIDMGQFREGAVQQVTVDGSVYGIPEFYNLITVLVNDAALEEAGMSVEDLDLSDWDSIAAFNEATTVNEGGELSRIGFDPKLPEFLPLWVAANGGMMLSEDGRTAMLNSPEVVEALEFAASLHETAGGRENFIAFRDTWDFFGAENQFVSNQLAAFPMEQWYANVLVESSPDVQFTAIPFLDREGNSITYATGSAWAIPTGATNPEAACAFAKTMTATETWTAAAQARADMRAEEGQAFTGVYTANSEADEVIFGEIRETGMNETFDNAVETILSVQDAAISTPSNPAGAEFRQAWTDAVNRVLNGEQEVQESLDQAQEEAQEALDEAWEE